LNILKISKLHRRTQLRPGALAVAIGLFVVLGGSTAASATSHAPSPAPRASGHTTYSTRGFQPPASAGRVVHHKVFADGRTQDQFADGSSLGTAPITYLSASDLKAGALQKLRAGSNPAQVVGTKVRTSPNGYVSGQCGISYVYLYNGNEPSGRGYHYDTGFKDTCASRNAPAVDFVWHVTVTGPGWRKADYDNGHPIYTYNLNLHNHWATPNAGVYNACVVQAAYANLSNGGTAYSGDPCGATNIY